MARKLLLRRQGKSIQKFSRLSREGIMLKNDFVVSLISRLAALASLIARFPIGSLGGALTGFLF
jgi:hypothetical protein